jgi:phosphoglycerol transferase
MHYFLSLYYQVPLAVLVALWVCGDDPPLVGERGSWRRGRSLAAMAICLLVSATGIYYAFFGGALILLGGIWASLTRRRRQNALAGALLATIIVAGLAVQAAPTLAYQQRHGENPEVASRHPGEAEVFGLRIAQLLLPVPGHRVPALRQVRRLYDATAPFPGEGSTTALGLAGSFGFLALLAFVLLRPSPTRTDAGLARSLAVLNLLAILLATTGGFGSLFALLVTPELRAYARMQVFVGFFALSAVALLLDQLARREGRRAWLGAILPPIILVLGLLDQVTPLAVRPYREIRVQYAADEEFVRRVEAKVPARAMIFELPYQTFPEADPGASRREVRYEPLRPYFHSGRLRWSYPAMSGRTADAFAKSVSASPPAELIRRLAEGGFAGIVIDRRGYDDDAEALGAALEREVGAPALFSDDGRVMFFDLTAVNGRVWAGVSPVERERRRDLAVHPLFLRWLAGFYEAEVGPDGTLRWCSGAGEIEIDNEAGSARRARITLNLATPLLPSRLAISGDLWSDHVDVGPAGILFSQAVVLPPGRHFVRLSSKGPPADAPSDPRRLVWRVDGATIEELLD